MRKIGFINSNKVGEKRIAILPEQLLDISNPSFLYFEKGYGLNLGISDDEYLRYGANVVEKSDIYKLDAICDPKIGDADYLHLLSDGQMLFGYFHAVQNSELTDLMIEKKNKCIAWEDMNKANKHLFWKNNEIAGKAAILHASTLLGKDLSNLNCAVIGLGNTGTGALKMLSILGAKIETFNRKTEKNLREKIGDFDIIVNCVLWDTKRQDHIVYKEDLLKMKKNSLIIDVSCDKNGGIQSSIPTTIVDPVYEVDSIIHYSVDNTPSIFYRDASFEFGEVIKKYLDILIEGKESDDNVLSIATIIDDGKIIDSRINDFQNR